MRWEYALVDANWNAMQTGTIEDVIRHAKEKNVGLLFWYNSGGPHNDVTEAPRDRMTTHEQRVKEFTQLKAWGVKGVKVDFWQSDKQDRIAQYRDLLKDAADFQLMVDFHGSTIPRGWQREFPNLIGMEAVAGAEQYKFREDYAAKAPWLNTVLPFTRNVAGPMDYTPVTFSDAKYPHVTTNAHELALSVVFDSPIQHFADSAVSYRAQPPEVIAFLREVPAAWDETRVLSGEPGKTIVIARREGAVWYVAGLNGTESPASVKVAVPFLGEGGWSVRSIMDGPGGGRASVAGSIGGITAASTADMAMSPRGGFVMRLEPASARGLDVYFIDVEGGQATLLVAPSGQSMLIDTGYPGNDGRDANRILAVAKQAGVARLDYLLVTHYHNDHVGNAPALAARIPIGTFVDHGESVETDDAAKALYASYANVRAAGSHLQVKPGDKVPLRDLDVTIVTAGGDRLARPLVTPPQPNAACAGFTPKPADASENARSVGSVIAFGRFRMVDFGDLTWNKEQELACPDNLLGTVDVYLTTHHGLDQSNAPVLVHALRPRVAIMNNGPNKGGEAQAMRTVRSSPGLVDFWQLHASLNAPDANVPAAMIANLDESTAHYIKLSAQRDGSFTVTNTRTGETRRYPAR
jgi:beta-lactamase superfamily II metal-dependent hydrolase